MVDGDDPGSALAALRKLAAERVADEAEERDAVARAPCDQVDLAFAILATRRPWSIQDRRALGLPRGADDGDWHAAVARRLAEIDPVVVVGRWLASVEDPGSRHTLPVVIEALGRLPGLAPIIGLVSEILRAGSEPARGRLRDALTTSTVPVDGAALALLREVLTEPDTSRDVATHAVLIAGAFAPREPIAAGLLTTRVRADRSQRRADAHSGLPLDEAVAAARAVSGLALAEAVVASRSPALAPTVMLELELESSSQLLAAWSRALITIAGEAGSRHLARIRGRPGRSALVCAAPPPFADPLDGLTTSMSDERRTTLEALAGAPEPALLQAFLLAAELDRYITRQLERTSWQPLFPIPWVPLLSAISENWSRIDDVISGTPEGGHVLRDQLAAVRANRVLEQLLDRGLARAPMPWPQTLTPALRELEVEGVESFARRIWTPPLSETELARLEADEAEVINWALASLA